jgi:putative membrane protein
MTGIQAACERLHTTPTPFAYTLLLHRTAWLFCLLLPFGLVSTLGLATPIVTVILAYAFFGLDALGQELQEPFESTDNAVPLDSLVRVIEIATIEVVGGRPVPDPLMPRDYVLL